MSHKIGITACSNPMHPSFSADLARLCQILRELGFDPVFYPNYEYLFFVDVSHNK